MRRMKPQHLIACALVDRAELQRRLNSFLQPYGECWLWTGDLYPGGYGRMFVAGTYVTSAHRVSKVLSTGVDFDYPFKACHDCPNRACCNPAHLHWDSQSENMKQVYRELRERERIGKAAQLPKLDIGDITI